jgi:tetratricopeptide (TPR) repeat protein
VAQDVISWADRGLALRLNTARGELAYERGRWSEARKYFDESARLWTDPLPHDASVEARAYLGLLDALEGAPERGQTAIRSSLEQAQRMERLGLEVLCRVHLARVHIQQRQFDDALRVLSNALPSAPQTISPELAAYVHFWRGQAMRGRGDQGGSLTELTSSRETLDTLQASFSGRDWEGVASRRDVRMMLAGAPPPSGTR